MSKRRWTNDDPFQPWNDPRYEDDPFAPHNDPMRQDDPFEPWNEPFGNVRDMPERDRRKYNQ